MTIQEFTDRTGLHPTEEKFEYIHNLYMSTNLDKDVFCKEYKKHGNSLLVEDLLGRISSKSYAYDALYELHDESKRKQNVIDCELALFLLGKAAVYNDPDFEHEAIRLTSRNTCVLIKIKNGYPLTDEDFAYIAEHLH